MEVFCPCSTIDLDCIVNFLYSGTVSCSTECDLLRIQDNLCEIFGFAKDFLLPDNFTDIETEFNFTTAPYEQPAKGTENSSKVMGIVNDSHQKHSTDNSSLTAVSYSPRPLLLDQSTFYFLLRD